MVNSTKKCPQCGQQLPTEARYCSKCGIILSRPQKDNSAIQPTRDDFVTLWLWFCIVANALVAIFFCITFFFDIDPVSTQVSIATRRYAVIISVLTEIGYVYLLKWRRLGFFIIVVMTIVGLLGNLIIGGLGIYKFVPLFSLAILYGVLQIRSKGVSYWNNLW